MAVIVPENGDEEWERSYCHYAQTDPFTRKIPYWRHQSDSTWSRWFVLLTLCQVAQKVEQYLQMLSVMPELEDKNQSVTDLLTDFLTDVQVLSNTLVFLLH